MESKFAVTDKKTCTSIKEQTKKFMGNLKGRIQTKNLELMHLLFSSLYRFMLIFFFTLLYVAGAITEKEIDSIENEFIRN